MGSRSQKMNRAIPTQFRVQEQVPLCADNVEKRFGVEMQRKRSIACCLTRISGRERQRLNFRNADHIVCVMTIAGNL